MLELTLTLAPVEGALLRLLGLVERRGFPLGAIQSRTTPDGLDVRLTPAAVDRPGDVLLRQVLRLHDVRQAHGLHPAAAGAHLIPPCAVPFYPR